MNKHNIQYTADYGRYRNHSGNWLYQQMTNEPSPECKSRKKQYPVKRCLIEKYKMLNVGQIYLPKVDDMILNVSDIQGTHTDTIQSDAVRNRSKAKHLRQVRQNQQKAKRQSQQIEKSKRKLIPISKQSKPKLSYHYLKRNIPQIIKTDEDNHINSIKQSKLERIKTLPGENIETNLKRLDDKQVISRNLTLPTIQYNPQKIYTKQIKQQRKQSFQQPVKHSLQLNDLNQKIESYKKYMQDERIQKRYNQRNHSDSHRYQRKIQNDIVIPKLTRINPTFLSFGSQYLINGNNYLASLGRRSILY